MQHLTTVAAACLFACTAGGAAAQQTQRPAILSNRWQEDWSALQSPMLRTQPLDRFKYIGLSASDPQRYLSLGANLRIRGEFNSAPGLGAAGQDGDTYLIRRLETHLDLRLDGFQAFLQLQDDVAHGKDRTGPADANRLDVEQAFVAWVAPAGASTFKARVGRQQFAFDLQRFVSVRDGPNVRQSFDAAWFGYETGTWRFIGYYSRPVVSQDARAFDDHSSPALQFNGIRIERKVLGDNELSGYWSRYLRQDAVFLSAAGNERRDVWDLRFAGKHGRLDWDAEAMRQHGGVGAQRISAWGIGTRVGFTAQARLTPRLGLQLDAASGDRDPHDGRLQTFNPLFPNGAYLALAGYTGYVNFLHLKPSLTLHPGSRTTLLFAGAAQWRNTTGDAVYLQGSVPLAGTAGTGKRWTGAYYQVRADVRLAAQLSCALEAVHFQAGSSLRASGAHDADFLGLELRAAW
ncbi:alginate export family protein [Stenotrophomonas sp. HITSZ_GD]|uniref:alginate export family protein n=1 Tax=Stenotrophomonas sp. HITSZ_GD TaxID=3037248 RepID=UPI00240DCBCA|nr:alginate export family protein [Stenotrophomonas sp. HITSZ_GD]MDG2524234.1 alginate export family protein [Stenotrophomonas sp. HITSZ_GD]